jgi:hypothetical protein
MGGVAVLAVGGIGAGIALGGGQARTTGGSGDDDVARAVAYDMCKDFVRTRLKAPATARFPDYWRGGEVVVGGAGPSYTVRAHVDSENSFGALLRTRFTCDVMQDGDKWTLNSLDLDD